MYKKNNFKINYDNILTIKIRILKMVSLFLLYLENIFVVNFNGFKK